MLAIEQTGKFRRDFKRELKGRNQAVLDTIFVEVLKTLANNQSLAKKYCDHSLTGDWKDHRECHIKSNFILIYRKPNDKILQLVRLGSHSKLNL